MPACMPWRSTPRRRANEVQRYGQGSRPNPLMASAPALGTIRWPARRIREPPNHDDRHQRAFLIIDGPFVVVLVRTAEVRWIM
jgi:hypothetical protein